MLRKRGECSGEDFDAMGLLQTLCLVKMDTVDAKKAAEAAAKPDQVVIHEEKSDKNNIESHNRQEDEDTMGTEMKGEILDRKS